MQSIQPEFFTQPLIKYTKPSSYDFLTYGTRWVFMDEARKEMYIQVGDEQAPRWEKMGFLLETAFDELFNNKQFIPTLNS